MSLMAIILVSIPYRYKQNNEGLA